MGMSYSANASYDIAGLSLLKALDPRYKLRYFAEQDWPNDWVNNVKDITRNVYDEDYPSPTAVDRPASPKKPPTGGDWPSLLRKVTTKAIFRERDELATFWASPCEPLDADPLQYWQGVIVSRPESRLAHMAIDYLTAPASSVDAERAFSRGALTVTHRRHALSYKSTRNSIVLGAWLKDTNLVPKDKLINMFRKKASRLQSSGSDSEDSVVENSNDSDST
jgi:hypothetical protein